MNLTLFLNLITYVMQLERIGVDFASSLWFLKLCISFLSELTTIQSNQAMDLVLLPENFQTFPVFFNLRCILHT